MRWLKPWWWRFIFTGQVWYAGHWYPRRPAWTDSLRHLFCRIRGHPHGPRWYNSGGIDPDMRCDNCGDDIG
jgi:hypothetical protein